MRGRDAQRLETRQRVFAAALEEFKRVGMADADIGAIVSAAGVARGTFYFHYPTKEHVLADLEHAEQVRMTSELERFLAKPHDLRGALREVIRLVTAIERRLGRVLFRDMLALHFSPTRPAADGRDSYPIIGPVVAEIARARDRGDVQAGVDPEHSAFFLLVTLYALLVTTDGGRAARAAALETFLDTVLRGLEPR